MYQIGALKALEEVGILEDVISISSCSIGAINAAFLAQYNIQECYEFWKDFTEQPMFKNVDQHAPDYLLQIAKETVTGSGLDLEPFIKLLDQYIDEDEVRRSQTEMIFSSYNMTKKKQEYHNIKNIPKGELINYMMASARLPFFKPVFINGDKYLDGGLGDNQPYYSELENAHFDLVIKIKIAYIPYYIPGISQSNITFNKELDIRPSKRLGTPIEFRKPSFEEKYQLGYADAKKALKSLS